ncbi:hypothetical protein, partial [Daejeonella sp. H1SJ63]|uniref:hypothetical protein n=1 Tax=Daejeonella sp. H1SJ63 TaxID=3034145 RepID=UPI0023ED88D7
LYAHSGWLTLSRLAAHFHADFSIVILKKYNSPAYGFNFHVLTTTYSAGIASFIERRFVITEQSVENIKNFYCRVFIENKNQEELYTSLQQFVQAYDLLIKAARKNNEKFAEKLSSSIETMDPFVWCVKGKALIFEPKLSEFIHST